MPITAAHLTRAATLAPQSSRVSSELQRLSIVSKDNPISGQATSAGVRAPGGGFCIKNRTMEFGSTAE
jgi:hypothetical protein